MSPKISPKSTLSFEIHFLDFSFKEKRKDELTNAERINLSGSLKASGNEAFKEKNFEKA